ncbi:MAG: polysaccharide deacetylase [Acidobacteriota bacterium]|nr:polysaccharide deacetylase [Acidobacteriota bacterium]
MNRLPLAALVILAACSPAPATPPAGPPDPLPGTRLSIDQLKSQMFHVSAGQRLKPVWPNGARVAVGLSFDVDNATAALSTGNLDYEILSRGEYGAVDGLPRILRMLDRQQVPASFFIPAASAVLHPAMIEQIMSARSASSVSSAAHEIGVHGWIHERLPLLNNEREEQRLLDLSIETLTRMTGKRPVGYRAPSWKFSRWTMGQVKAAGFLYDSSLMASDDAYEILLDGTPTGIVELPIERILDDAPYFGSNADGSNPSVGDVYEVFQSEFDVAYDEGGLYLLTLHPHMIGHRSRTAMLEKLVQYIKGKPGVWFATHEQIANHVKPLIAAK